MQHIAQQMVTGNPKQSFTIPQITQALPMPTSLGRCVLHRHRLVERQRDADTEAVHDSRQVEHRIAHGCAVENRPAGDEHGKRDEAARQCDGQDLDGREAVHEGARF